MPRHWTSLLPRSLERHAGCGRCHLDNRPGIGDLASRVLNVLVVQDGGVGGDESTVCTSSATVAAVRSLARLDCVDTDDSRDSAVAFGNVDCALWVDIPGLEKVVGELSG
jgi:hypothetical protein